MLTFTSAFFCGVLAWIAIWKERRSVAQWAFVAGMAILAAEDLFYSFAADAALPEGMIYWQDWRLAASAFLPVAWITFSLSYARGNASEFLKQWRWILLAAFLIPTALILLTGDQLIVSAAKTDAGQWRFGLGIWGMILNLFSLLGLVLVLMNLERTYRAAVGTMLWRIKFMVLGLGVVFAVRLYCSSQTLLFHNTLDLSLQAVAATATVLGGLLVLRSLFRAGHFNTDVYPSQTVLYNSLTVLLTGIYLLIVAFLPRWW
jgi:N-terminal 7TM region of histidine kinase